MKNRTPCTDDWKTPPFLLRKLNDEFNFDCDPCPWKNDITKWDGLSREWGRRNFVNPPYSINLKTAFVRRAASCRIFGRLSVLLLPVSTSTNLFHTDIMPNITAPIRYIYKRIPFIGTNDKGQLVNYHLIGSIEQGTIIHNGLTYPLHIKASGQFDSMICVFDGSKPKLFPDYKPI